MSMYEMLVIEVPPPRPFARRPEVYQSNTPAAGRLVEASAVTALEHGRDNLARCGWLQDGMGDAERGFCTVGALLADHDVTSDALVYLAKAIGVDASKVDDWNDTPGRTVTEVLDAYDHAIKFAREDAENSALSR